MHVVLYNFKSRHQDELDLKAGYKVSKRNIGNPFKYLPSTFSNKVTVIDKSDPDWWKGKCLGRIGYFPSKYCAKLAAGEKPLQVTHNLQVSDGDRGELTLLRDQIVIQVRYYQVLVSFRRVVRNKKVHSKKHRPRLMLRGKNDVKYIRFVATTLSKTQAESFLGEIKFPQRH